MTKNEKDYKQAWRNPLAILIGTSLLFLAVQATSAVAVAPFSNKLDKSIQLTLFSVTNLVILFLSLSTIKKYIQASWRAIGLFLPKTKDLVRVIPALFLYFLISLAITSLAIKFVPNFNVEQAQDVGFNNIKQPLEFIAGFLTLVILTPIFEETVFRGMLFKGLRRRLPFWLSAAVTSLIFAAAHMQLNVAIDTFALGLILCYLVERSSSVVPAILLHALKNGLAFTLLFIIK